MEVCPLEVGNRLWIEVFPSQEDNVAFAPNVGDSLVNVET